MTRSYTVPNSEKSRAHQAAARARWAGTTPEQRSEFARRVVRVRWDRVAAERGNENGGPAAA
ncbi:hypothetical protein Q5530_05595 [Saccharothrix sp. BKS2]|uniref:hypothetical protein n=1 Tax=Saccharothrix sp. BKS2 TaxID=3064400 RepID=UPI0039EA99D0